MSQENVEAKGELMSQDEKTFQGQCFCGAVTIVVTGDPERRLLPLRLL